MDVPNFYEDPKPTDGAEINPSLESLPRMRLVHLVPENILIRGYEDSLKTEASILTGGKVYVYNAKNNSLSRLGSQKGEGFHLVNGASIENIRDSLNIHVRSLHQLINDLERHLDPTIPEQRAIMNCQKMCLSRYVLEFPDGRVSLRTLLRIRNNDGCAVTYHESYGAVYSFGNVALTELVGELVPNPTFFVQVRYSYEAFAEELNLLSSSEGVMGLYFHTRPRLYTQLKLILSLCGHVSREDISISSIIPISVQDQLYGDKHLIDIAEGSQESKSASSNGAQTNRFIIDSNVGMFFCCFELNRMSGRVLSECKKIR